MLKGPPGAGKTATMSVLAQSMRFNILEWNNPGTSDPTSAIHSSASLQFDDFLGRGGKFQSLMVDRPEKTPTTPNSTKLSADYKVILLEEFPNTFVSSSNPLQSFRSSMLQQMATQPSINSQHPPIPVVVIISETSFSTTAYAGDNLTAHRLLGAEIMNHPKTTVIEFNPIAATYLTKALDLVIQKEARDSRRRRVPGPLVLSKLGEVGDVRSAIGCLEFLCIKADDKHDWGGTVASKGKKRSKATSVLTDMEKQSLQLVTNREATIGIFHAVGKIVYNKRDEAATSPPRCDAPVQPPAHFPQHVRMRVSEVPLEELANEIGADTQTFVAGLHENYVLSCFGDGFTDALNGCMEALSDSDFLIPKSGSFGGSGISRTTFEGLATDSLRQEQISFEVAVRGLLFSLPYPVKRQAYPSGISGRNGSRGDAYKMFYPVSMRLAKQMEETEGVLEQWTQWYWDTALQSKASTRTTTGSQQRGDDVASWGQRSMSASTFMGRDRGHEDAFVRTSCRRDELVQNILPYAAMIKHDKGDQRIFEKLDRAIRFHGSLATGDEPAEEATGDQDDLLAIDSYRATPKVTISKSVLPQQASSDPRTPTVGHVETGAAVEDAVRHLYLSDDDIEDD